MAKRTITTCDFQTRGKVCGKDAPQGFEVKSKSRAFHADLCDEHLKAVEQTLAKMGLAPSSWTHGQKRKAYTTASGESFSNADVRAWLLEQGKDVAPTGRLPRALLDEYAESH